jgi:hypothetical protein
LLQVAGHCLFEKRFGFLCSPVSLKEAGGGKRGSELGARPLMERPQEFGLSKRPERLVPTAKSNKAFAADAHSKPSERSVLGGQEDACSVEEDKAARRVMIDKTVRHLHQRAGNERPILPLLVNFPALLQTGYSIVARALIAA